jgi:hypothetical protein
LIKEYNKLILLKLSEHGSKKESKEKSSKEGDKKNGKKMLLITSPALRGCFFI